jgi:2-methylisocitrate lyase-like PEP mutase family enzyme
LAAERVRQAAVAARSLGFKFTLTARAENHVNGRADLKDTIRRLQAFQEAGADVLFAPGIAAAEDIRQILAAVDRPVNVLIGMPGMRLTVPQLQELGVTRISLGASLARAAYGAMLRAATEILATGSFDYTAQAASRKELEGIFTAPRA